MSLNFEKISDGVADREKTFELINRGYGPDQRFAGQWFETTEEIYWYFLEVLPPHDFTGDGFSMSEFATGSLTDAFVRIGERYFCLCISRETPRDFTVAMTAFKAINPTQDT